MCPVDESRWSRAAGAREACCVHAGRGARLATAAALLLASFILRGGDLLGELGRQHQVGHLAERHLHLVGVDALALVLRPQVSLHALKLQQHQLVELAVLVALVTRARQLRFQLGDAGGGGVLAHGMAR
jgi:hypothetical protein